MPPIRCKQSWEEEWIAGAVRFAGGGANLMGSICQSLPPCRTTFVRRPALHLAHVNCSRFEPSMLILAGRPVIDGPVFNTQTVHPVELAEIIGDQHQAAGFGLSGDQGVVGTDRGSLLPQELPESPQR